MVKENECRDPKKQAAKEVEEERYDSAKNKYKSKLKELQAAQKIVKNIEREIEDLDDELAKD